MLSRSQIREFLERTDPPMLGVVGTICRDGSPHVVPVWYRYDGQVVRVWTKADRLWVRNLARDSRVACSVQAEQPPQAGVTMRGRAKITTVNTDTVENPEVNAEIRRITRRYVAEEGVEDYVRRYSDLRTIVTITPERIASWSGD